MPLMTILKQLGAGVMLAAVASGLAHADANDDRIAALQAKYRCPIFEYLTAIHRKAHKEDEQNRFLIAEIIPGDHQFYVQCAFFDMDHKLHCEAASAYYDDRLKAYFTDARLQILGRLGYSTTMSSMNYYFERPAQTQQSLYEIAGTVVETLGRVFDMQPAETLAYHAPMVKRLPAPTKSSRYCTPAVS